MEEGSNKKVAAPAATPPEEEEDLDEILAKLDEEETPGMMNSMIYTEVYLSRPGAKSVSKVRLKNLSEEEVRQFKGPGGSDEKEWQSLLKKG